MNIRIALTPPRRQSGFNLIELMISMLLGLLVVGAAIGIFLSNRQTYAATEGLSRIQESARTGFEMMAQDIREAGGNPCDSGLPVANVLNNPTASWWTNWSLPLTGYENSNPSNLTVTSGTDAIQILSAGTGGATVTAHNPANQTLTLNAAAPDLHSNAIMLLCDRQQLAVLQVNSVSGTTANYSSGGLNACTRLGRLPGVCVAGSNNYQYEINSILTEVRAVRWYVAASSGGAGGTSLYQEVIAPGGTSQKNEIADGVTGLQFNYLSIGQAAYQPANVVTNWANVIAVKIDMTVSANTAAGTNQQPATRTFSTIVSIRNRNP
ncbi:PilW family protein [Xanthomonas rydalmerensis]|uniref:Prepilin-type N-terminal cleavage/methylation domain-containing protein n=1 Tax=Xanthomonas rydalmerensis TaxID=3046274 RepID=A0ABZ0JSJ3_9XANT|nr:PilW family protein [Xanthomonas sp. DM-2023]WOS42361.1 prepilin-type N-terminal cleavage/methylation domain-containing protein [Xanthomonas sp. DM-2023]WOS46548.1 prepilin-type N-terminal cleavage/methylation domain-containing protein [Xanthomonas sp. DM-2023]WOS50727.1 prepilin-type N-terminal cleavage/methylation domain-containing protein [Xanthomonas sp. DM-2023]WOS54907.1 prepilin-type N-terminal cleavage/methylation domain-containing protein [Xanthomonas sp. DM-2023]WOS59090.1 prepili